MVGNTPHGVHGWMGFTMRFRMRKDAGKWVPASPLDGQMQARRNDYLARMKDGAIVESEIKRIHSEKTQAQLGAYWGLLIETVWRELDEMGVDLATFLKSEKIAPGLPVTREILHEYLTAACGHVAEDGAHKRLSDMNTAEASRYFDACRTLAAGSWGIIVPDPVPQWSRQEAA